MRWLVLLLGVTGLAAFIGPLFEGRDRTAEQAIRAYAQAVEAGDVESALGELSPDQRAAWRIFVEHQAGDRIRILSVAVQREPLRGSLLGWQRPVSVTAVGEILGKGNEWWRASTLIEGRMVDGRWQMKRPPFGPEEPWLVPPDS